MKKIIINFFIITVSIVGSSLFAQNHNTKSGFGAEGYDVVSYFDNKPIKGNSEFKLKYKDIVYRFANEVNKEKFRKSPSKYVPQYGGWCAYAMGKDGSKVSINPQTFEIRDGKLYLFYNKLGTNTLKLWREEGAEDLKKQADQNWKKLSE